MMVLRSSYMSFSFLLSICYWVNFTNWLNLCSLSAASIRRWFVEKNSKMSCICSTFSLPEKDSSSICLFCSSACLRQSVAMERHSDSRSLNMSMSFSYRELLKGTLREWPSTGFSFDISSKIYSLETAWFLASSSNIALSKGSKISIFWANLHKNDLMSLI